MNRGDLKGLGSIDTYTRLAPSVDRVWTEQFVLEQRLLGVPGKRIGDSLALVESHVAESGESAQAAFGDPREYAQRDAPEQSDASSDRMDRGWVFSIIVCLVGMLFATFSAQAGFAGESALGLTAGHVVVLIIVATQLGLLLFRPHAVMRLLTQHPIRGGIGYALLFAAMVGALLILQHPLGEIDVLTALLIGGALLATGFLLQLRAYLGGHVQEDPIVGPNETPAKTRKGLVAILIFPVATIVMIGFSWFLVQIPKLF